MTEVNLALQSHPQPQPILQMSSHSFPPGAPLNGDTASKSPEPPISYSWREKHPDAQFFYIRDHIQANEVIQHLPPGPYGLDLEWKPIYRKGESENPVALVQLANHKIVVLLQLKAMKVFPIKLRDFLANPEFVKAGVGIQNDAKKLFQDCNVDTRGCVDLALLARTVDNKRWKGKYNMPIGLARLVATYEDRTLVKGKITRSNWERKLNEAQQMYAANDAHAGYVIYMRLTDMMSSLSYTPVASYYTCDSIGGRLCDPSGATWLAQNPHYDPGPPPPPREPKPPQETQVH